MRKILTKWMGTLTVLALVVGCAGPYQRQMEQTMLLQENQRLEQALYVTHAQLVDLKKENETLKATADQTSKTPDGSESDPVPQPKKRERTPTDNFDEAPPFTPPKVSIPSDAPKTPTIPDSLKGAGVHPKLRSPVKSNTEIQLFPPVPVQEMKASTPQPTETETAFPVWGPTR